MRWVSAPVVRPHQCVCIPSISGRHQRGFFDWNTNFPVVDGRVYVSVVAAEQMAKFMGWTPKNQDAGLKRELEAEKQENARLGEVVADLEAQLAAVAVLKNGSFKQQGAPGRPPKTERERVGG